LLTVLISPARLKTTSAYGEAARVLLDYGRDVEGSIAASCEGSEFREAIRIVSLSLTGVRFAYRLTSFQATLYSRSELIESSILPAAEEALEHLTESIEEAHAQIKKQADRLHALGDIRRRDPGVQF